MTALKRCSELQEHAPDLPASPLVGEAEKGRAVMSTINRNSGTHQPEPTSQASTGSAHTALLAELPAIRQQLRHTLPQAAEHHLVDICLLTSADSRLGM